MTEIKKMFENAGINKREIENCTYKNSTPCGHSCDDGEDCPYLEIKNDYPPFTAEKQIELIKTIEAKCDFIDCIQIVYRPMEDLWKISIIPVLEMAFEEMYLYFGCDKDFSTALAMAINNLWQDLTDQEKEEIRNILNA